MDTLNPIAAVKRFFEQDARKVETAEMMAFWKACNTDERREFAESAAKQLGVQITTASAAS